MTAEATDALVDAIEASYGLPVPTPRQFAARIEQQLAARGHEVGRRRFGGDEPGDWGFTASDERELAEIIAAARLAGMVTGTVRFARAVLAAGYRRSAAPSPRWELRGEFTDQAAPDSGS
jgi:hypothetical protein